MTLSEHLPEDLNFRFRASDHYGPARRASTAHKLLLVAIELQLTPHSLSWELACLLGEAALETVTGCVAEEIDVVEAAVIAVLSRSRDDPYELFDDLEDVYARLERPPPRQSRPRAHADNTAEPGGWDG